MPLVRITLEDGDVVNFDTENVWVDENDRGVTVRPRNKDDNKVGFLRLFFPWREIRQLKEESPGGTGT